jgi:predicted dehydrogenase
MKLHSNRRDFLRGATAAGTGLWLADAVHAAEKSPNERLQFACIGVGGKGTSDTADAAKFGDVIAICDVDDNILAKAAERYPSAKRYNDFRKLLEELGDKLDGVTVSTPDHTHAVAAAMAMKLGKHCFCQKPLTHSIWEARRLGEIAREKKVATQMGNQGTASDALRRSAAKLKAGVVGTIQEVHVWTNRPVWDQGGPRPAEAEVPANLHWDLWLGPRPERPYGKGYHTFGWRGYWDFGTGALGDMACHTFNMVFMGVGLKDPVSVVAQTSGHNRDSYPKWSIITFEFPETAERPAVKVLWYDGGKRPSPDLLDGMQPAESGALIRGTKGTMYCPGDYGSDGRLLGGATDVEVEFTKSPGHFEEWVRAIRGGDAAVSNFPNYAGPLTETILLGNLAVWADGKKIEWDAKRLKPTNAPEVEDIVRGRYRDGWDLVR